MPESTAEYRPRDEDDFDYDDGCCYRCDGSGIIITCIDDMCRGAGECFHGDGEEYCPVCNEDGHKL